MRIIQVNKFNYLRGGAEKYFLEITDNLRQQGHEVAVFSMHHPKNIPSPWDKYFVSKVDFYTKNWFKKLLISGRILYSFSAAKKFEKLIKDFKPDIIHFHNIYHQLSPSIIKVAKKYNIPTILHLHDYKLICPNYKLFTHNEICERCRGGKYYNCLKYSCVNNSKSRSFLAMIEMYLHHKILKIYEKNIDLFIAPSQYMKDTCVRFSWPQKKIIVLHNFFSENKLKIEKETLDNYFLYFGRLSSEKGIDTLLQSITETKENLKIAGTGPEEEKLKRIVKNLKIEDKVEFLGFKSEQALQTLITKAKAIIIPSIWPENMPFSLIESIAKGKIVIASKVGGLPELINDKNGLLFSPNNYHELSKRIEEVNKLHTTPEEIRKEIENLELKQHIKTLLDIYHQLLNTKKEVE